MERECQEECVLIHFDLLRETIDRYLKKHSFCDECTKMVNKAYTLLVTDDEESECCDSTAPKCCGHETPNQNQSSQCKGMYTVCKLNNFSVIQCTVWKNEKFSLTKKIISSNQDYRHNSTLN